VGPHHQTRQISSGEITIPFAPQKKGAWPSRPCGDWPTFSQPCPSEPKEQTAAHRRDALCPSTKRISLERQLFSNQRRRINYPLCTAKEGGMAVSAVWRLVCFLATLPIGTKGADRSTQARRAVPLYKTNLIGAATLFYDMER
jgi:hypothetical protein